VVAARLRKPTQEAFVLYCNSTFKQADISDGYRMDCATSSQLSSAQEKKNSRFSCFETLSPGRDEAVCLIACGFVGILFFEDTVFKSCFCSKLEYFHACCA